MSLDGTGRQALADAVPGWWHSIELGEGAVSRGRKTPEIHARELEYMRLPDLRGKTVLDIGAWDGFYSFHAEERGARRVVALDQYMWGLEPGARAGEPDLERLPGRRAFDLAHGLRGSRVEPVVGDFMTTDLDALGRFDVVLFLGVLYHLQDPLAALHRLRRVTGELAVIETHGVVVPDFEHRLLWELYPGAEVHGDASTWWGPNARGLVGACEAAGFEAVELLWETPRPGVQDVTPRRLVVHARPTASGTDGPITPAPARARLVRAQLDAARADAAAAWRELDVVYASRSWRLTAPLRAAGAALRRARRSR